MPLQRKSFCMSGWTGGGGLRLCWWRREWRCWRGSAGACSGIRKEFEVPFPFPQPFASPTDESKSCRRNAVHFLSVDFNPPFVTSIKLLRACSPWRVESQFLVRIVCTRIENYEGMYESKSTLWFGYRALADVRRASVCTN